MQRNDVEWLLSASPDEFDMDGAREARDLLDECARDIKFQTEEVPYEEFSGPDYYKWRKSAVFKLNRVLAAKTKFNNRYEDLWAESEIYYMKKLYLRTLDGDEDAKGELLEICLKP